MKAGHGEKRARPARTVNVDAEDAAARGHFDATAPDSCSGHFGSVFCHLRLVQGVRQSSSDSQQQGCFPKSA